MPLRKAQPFTFRAFGVCDAVDATNAVPGAMQQLVNLIPSPSTKQQFIPRPASTQVTNFTGFTSPAQGEALFVVGTRAYGMIASGRNTGKSEPFCYDLNAGAFVSLANVTSANCPTSQPTTGDWTPATMAMVGNRILITHPGYDGTSHFVGWIDMRGFTSNSITGSTHTSTLIDTLSSNPIAAGWMVGDAIAGSGIPANTYIVSMTTTSVTLSNATTATAAGVTLTVTSGTTIAPLYGAGQTNGTPLVATPAAVFNFNNRAYYAVNNGLQYADSLNPCQITNASQALTLGDSVAVTALGGVPLSNQVAGGTLQSMIAFKGDAGYWQVTGDPALNNLTVSTVAGTVGTEAPNSLCATPQGLAYVAHDGLRVIGLDGKCSDPIGLEGSGVCVPFLYAVSPTRICAAYNEGVIRISVQNGSKNGQPVEEYWLDMVAGAWTGPHSFPAGLIEQYTGASKIFVLFASGINAKLWESTLLPTSTSTYTENGAAMSFAWQTGLMPDNQQGCANQVVQAALGLVMPSGQSVAVAAYDEQGGTLDSLSLSSVAMPGAAWGSFTWGSGVWGGAVTAYQEYRLPWHNALVFKQMSIAVTGYSVGGFAIGNLYASVQPTGYLGAH